MTDNFENLNSMQLDVLKEIGNIGSGNAVTALASMLDREIDMSVPTIKIVPFTDIVNLLNGPEELVVATLIGMEGGISGHIMLVMSPDEAYEVASLAYGEKRVPPQILTLETIDPMDMSALMEVSNILVGSYLSAISALTDLQMEATVPALAIDMAAAIVSIIAIEYSRLGDNVLFLGTEFNSADKSVSGRFFLIPDNESFSVLMKSLGLES